VTGVLDLPAVIRRRASAATGRSLRRPGGVRPGSAPLDGVPGRPPGPARPSRWGRLWPERHGRPGSERRRPRG